MMFLLSSFLSFVVHVTGTRIAVLGHPQTIKGAARNLIVLLLIKMIVGSDHHCRHCHHYDGE